VSSAVCFTGESQEGGERDIDQDMQRLNNDFLLANYR